MVANAGLPPVLAYGTIVGEFFAPILVLIGFKTRIAALVIAFNMLMSIVIAHRDIAFSVNDYGGWMIELNVIYLLTAVAIYFIGPGRYAIEPGK